MQQQWSWVCFCSCFFLFPETRFAYSDVCLRSLWCLLVLMYVQVTVESTSTILSSFNQILQLPDEVTSRNMLCSFCSNLSSQFLGAHLRLKSSWPWGIKWRLACCTFTRFLNKTQNSGCGSLQYDSLLLWKRLSVVAKFAHTDCTKWSESYSGILLEQSLATAIKIFSVALGDSTVVQAHRRSNLKPMSLR